MNLTEMSNEFDIYYNQVNSNQAAGIDEYEKSVFLTKAQDEIIKAYFDPRGNKFIEGFDGSEKRQYDFSLLIVNTRLDDAVSSCQYDPRSLVYAWPNDALLILNESITETCDGINYIYQVLPISYTEYQRLMQKPYQYPSKRQAWRLITGNVALTNYTPENQTTVKTEEQELSDMGETTPPPTTQTTKTICEIIGRFRTDNIEYRMRYVKKPTPIILVDLDTDYAGLTIDNYHGNESGLAETGGGIACKLPDGIHREIVQRAVELATAVYNPQALGTITGIGNVSSTNIGIVPRQEGK